MRLLYLLFLFAFGFVYAQKPIFKLTLNPVDDNRSDVLIHLKKVNVYAIEYSSFDATGIRGFVISPKDQSKKYPVVIYNRGGNGSYGMVQEAFILNFLAKIAAEGYVVIGSQLRGSEGSEGTDEFGGKDVSDVLSLLDIIDKLDYADGKKIGQIGWSRGGLTNFLMLKKTARIKITINIAGPANLMKSRPKMFDVYRARIPGYTRDSVAVLNKLSPIYQVDSIKNKKMSLLFIHGEKDIHVDVSNSRELYAAAQKAGIRSELFLFPEGDHSLRSHYPDLLNRITAWLKKEL